MPHAHILVRFKGKQPVDSEEIDEYSSVKLPGVHGHADECDCPGCTTTDHRFRMEEVHCGSRNCHNCRLGYLVRKNMVHNHYPERCGMKRSGDDVKPIEIH